MWFNLTVQPFSSSDFLFPFCLICTLLIVMGWFGAHWALAAWPANDALHSSRTEITISRARWFDKTNTLIARSYPLSDISQVRYGVIARAKGSTIYGLRFLLKGKKQKLLAGLEAPEAAKILTALKSLGADVPDDQSLQKRIKDALELRGDTGWMDRSWMDADKN